MGSKLACKPKIDPNCYWKRTALADLILKDRYEVQKLTDAEICRLYCIAPRRAVIKRERFYHRQNHFHVVFKTLKANDFCRMKTAKDMWCCVKSVRNWVNYLKTYGYEIPDSPFDLRMDKSFKKVG